MARFDTLKFVSTAGMPGDKPRVVGALGSIPGGFQSEIESSLSGWSGLGKVGFAVPALSSFLLKQVEEKGPENFYAISVTWCEQDVHHQSFLVPASEYAQFDYNPYRFVAELSPEHFGSSSLVLPGWEGGKPLGTETKSLVLDGLQQLLSRGELHLPLAAPATDSDRILSILVATLPLRSRAGLRFTSFCPVDPWDWNLAAVRQPGGSLVDWKRRVMDLVGNDLDPQIATYLKSVGQFLTSGHEQGLAELTRRAGFQPQLNTPAGSPRIQAVTPGGQKRRAPGGIPLAGARQTVPQIPVATSPDSVTRKQRPRGERMVLERRKLRHITLAESRRKRRLPRWVVTAFFLGVAALVGWSAGVIPQHSLMDLSRKLMPGAPAPKPSPADTQLLSVVDVARSYEDILMEYRAGLRGSGKHDQKPVVRALADLRTLAAGPLIHQVDAYMAVVGNGIQQGWQPNREVRRLEALAQEGQDLNRDITRLKLAWYSLSQGVLWQDLGRIDDTMVRARFDSLATEQSVVLARADIALGLEDLHDHLRSAVGQISAMAKLVSLFQVTTWSAQWQTDLLASANRIPPAASPITRAYRNSAFVLARLKDAEHTPEAMRVPLGLGWGMGSWPLADVRAQLPALRRVAGMFPQGQSPPVMEGVVAIYSLLEDESRAADLAAGDSGFWLGLYSNYAVNFDPVVFSNVLGRLRFEALRPFLDRGDPVDMWPEHLLNKAMAPGIFEFYGMLATVRDPEVWRTYAEQVPDSFFSAWATYLGANYGDESRERLVAFTQAGDDLITLSHGLKSQAQTGRDCTARWLDLHTAALTFLDRYVLAFSENPVCQIQVAAASNLLDSMSQPLTIHLTGVVLHFNSPVPVGPVKLELVVKPEVGGRGGEVRVIAEGLMATGGKIQADLETLITLQPQQWVEVRARSEGEGQILFDGVVPSLLERVGPAGLARDLVTDQGTLSFTVEPGAWRDLKIPELTEIF